MEHLLADLARDRQREMLTAAATQRTIRRARAHGREARIAARAERRQLREQAARLRADLKELESADLKRVGSAS